MAGFVMFSHCKLLQAQSRAAAKAEHEDQLSNGDAPGVGTYLLHSAVASMHCACVTQCELLCDMHILPLHSCAGGIEKQALLSSGQWQLDPDDGSPSKRGAAPHRRNSSDA